MTGSGTLGDPYIITTAADLQAIEDNLGSYYELGGNIDASATSTWNSNAGFDPIILFTGQLDGKGYTISDLFINRPTEDYVGLIGYINANVVLRNISIRLLSKMKPIHTIMYVRKNFQASDLKEIQNVNFFLKPNKTLLISEEYMPGQVKMNLPLNTYPCENVDMNSQKFKDLVKRIV